MQRPTSVTVFGILNLVFGVFGILGTLGSLALFAATDSSSNPVIKIIHDSPSYAAWMKVTIPIGMVACCVLLASGVGLLGLKAWARKASIGYGIYAIIFCILSSVVNFFYLVKPLLEEAAQKQGPESAGAVGGAIGGLVGGVLGLIYPILLIIYMTRPKVMTAFDPSLNVPPPIQMA